MTLLDRPTEAPAGAARRPATGAFSPPGHPRPSPRGIGAVGIALLTALCTVVAVWPLTNVVQAGRWSAEAFFTAGAVILVGAVVRGMLRDARRRIAVPVILLVQVVVFALVVCLLEFRGTAPGGILPSPAVLAGVRDAFAQTAEEIAVGAAPLPATAALTIALVVGIGALAVLFDLLIGVVRMPLAAALLVSAVGVAPAIAVPGEVNLPWFVVFAVALLLLLFFRVEPLRNDSRPAAAVATPRRRPGVAVATGAAAIAASLVIAPALPVSDSGLYLGGSTVLDPTLRLGDDLRRPVPVTALRLVTDADRAPYLRIATLSSFDGEAWHPDAPQMSSLTEGLGPVSADDADVVEHRTTIRITGVTGDLLPVPYQATEVRGLDGIWLAAADNRTLSASDADAADQNYTVDSGDVQPTLERIRAATASGAAVPDRLRELPDDLPAVIAETAASITGAQPTDYDKLLTLQTWFRAGFRYSLDTPVEDGFDGTGAEAVARFLEVRSGYCIHFAGAFALMARTLGMPSRIVVGYLPGTAVETQEGGRVLYEVASDQLHAWPEIYFEGLGWIRFEPTATLGIATRFDPAVGTGSGDTAPEADTGDAPSAAPEDDGVETDDTGAAPTTPELRPLDPYPVVWAVFGTLAVLLLPALVRAGIRMRRRARMRDGDALAAWDEIADTLRDLGLPAPGTESPRARGRRLVAERGVDDSAVDALVRAVEQASYAPDPATVDGDALLAATRRIRADLLASMSRRDRWSALLTPRSLLGGRLAPASAG